MAVEGVVVNDRGCVDLSLDIGNSWRATEGVRASRFDQALRDGTCADADALLDADRFEHSDTSTRPRGEVLTQVRTFLPSPCATSNQAGKNSPNHSKVLTRWTAAQETNGRVNADGWHCAVGWTGYASAKPELSHWTGKS